MKIIFGTTSLRKQQDLKILIDLLKLDIQVLDLNDIGWDRGEIVEYGKTIEENSLIKANAILNFCKDKNLNYPIITDDSGLFCDGLNGEPGVYTGRYADEEIKQNPNLPQYQSVFKLLKKLENNKNRKASYRSCVTCMMPDGTFFQEFGESSGHISKKIIGNLTKPYLYSIFVLNNSNKSLDNLTNEELINTYRFNSLKKVLTKMNIE